MRVPRRLLAPPSSAVSPWPGRSPPPRAGATRLRPLPVPGVQYCAAVLGHVPGADTVSPLLGRACSPGSHADAVAQHS